MLKPVYRPPALEVRDLRVQRNSRDVWSGLSFALTGGTLLCVTGSNGSGKTTLLSTLAGITEPEEGDILWYGKPARKSTQYRRQMAYLAHHNGLCGDLPVIDNLRYAARLANHSLHSERDIGETLQQVGMEKHAKRLLKQLSQGQQRRVALARLLLQRARLWLLDEPFNALDAAAAQQLGAVLASHLALGGMAVIATHQPIAIAASVQHLAL